MSLATELGTRVASLKFQDCPADAVRWASIALLDTIGVTIAGSNEPASRHVREALGEVDGSGRSLLLGSDIRTNSLDAAQINGTAAHALDFDDSSNTLFGHPSAPMLSAQIALAEEIGCSGSELLVSYMAGFETIMRLARVATLDHYDRGWHSTATLGVFGVAAACARMLGLSAHKTATALALSASMASGIKANFGSMAKPFHVGQCARNGLFAALLAKSGFTAKLTSLEDRDGFFAVYSGTTEIDVEGVLASWSREWDILEPGIAIKQYPCCGSTHSSIDAVLSLAHRYDLAAENVARIETRTNSRSFGHTDRPNPQSPLDAKFSIQYCVARAMVDRRVALEHFEADSIAEPAVRAVLSRVAAMPREGPRSLSEVDLSSDVTIEMIDGNKYTERVEVPLGRGPNHPLSAELLKSKFVACTRRVLPEPAVERLYETIQGIEGLEKVTDLTDRMIPMSRRERDPARS